MKKKIAFSLPETGSQPWPCHCKRSSKEVGDREAVKGECRMAAIPLHSLYTATGPLFPLP